jgi:hypothetical protein
MTGRLGDCGPMLVAAMLTTGATGGCMGLPKCSKLDATYVLVDHGASQVEGTLEKAEITNTPAYKALHDSFKTVALRMPDNCYEASLHAAENRENAELQSRCGIPLQVLESTLTRAGYQVLSWTTLMGIEHDQHVPVHIAAQQLGADIIIVVNDTHAGPEKTASAAESRYRYLESDASGNVKGPARLFNWDREWLKTFVRNHIGDDPHEHDPPMHRARLNATVVLARGNENQPAPRGNQPSAATTPPPPSGSPTTAAPGPTLPPGISARSGEAIWFYSWSFGDPNYKRPRIPWFLFGSVPMSECKRLFSGENSGCLPDENDPNRHYWWSVAPPTPQNIPVPQDVATSEEGHVAKMELDPEKDAALARKIADDFIHRFKEGL